MKCVSTPLPGRQPSLSWLALLTITISLATVSCRPEEANSPAPASPSASNSVAPAAAPSSDLSSTFTSSTETLFQATTPADLAKFQSLQQAKITEAPDGISVQASGIDPSILVPEFSMKPCVVKVEVTAPAATAFQIFYLVGPQTVYTEANSVVQRINKGKNTIYLRIDAANQTGKWRVDPGDQQGTYIIHSFEVRGLGGTR